MRAPSASLSSRNLSSRCGPSIGSAEPLLELGGAAGMIDMAMGQRIFSGVTPVFSIAGQDAREIAARIDHRAAVAGLVPQDRAVLLERSHGDDGGLQRHGELARGVAVALS